MAARLSGVRVFFRNGVSVYRFHEMIIWWVDGGNAMKPEDDEARVCARLPDRVDVGGAWHWTTLD